MSGEKRRFQLRPATSEDAEILWPMVLALNAQDGHPAGPQAQRALHALLGPERDRGLIRLIECDGTVIGYVVVCFGFSVEFGGRDAFLDEIWLTPALRGAGLGADVLEAMAGEVRAAGCVALHLEVMPDNPAARLYRRAGFAERGRLMTRRLV
jgi:ribosomal protein S18 acetylase RimI-like enzyme